MSAVAYDQKFFDGLTAGALRSARRVAPLVLELSPAGRVVDFGCGRGAWLLAFREAGATTVLGLDGPYVDPADLLIEPAEFRPADLSRPIALGSSFDLAVCLEVGEHLPPRASATLVRSLTEAAPVVLFSAAVPGQGGTSHLNEQWPEYWERRFDARGFERLDPIRPRVWSDASVEWWYRQNTYLFADASHASSIRDRASQRGVPVETDIHLMYKPQFDMRYKSFRSLLGEAAAAGLRAARARLLKG